MRAKALCFLAAVWLRTQQVRDVLRTFGRKESIPLDSTVPLPKPRRGRIAEFCTERGFFLSEAGVAALQSLDLDAIQSYAAQTRPATYH